MAWELYDTPHNTPINTLHPRSCATVLDGQPAIALPLTPAAPALLQDIAPPAAQEAAALLRDGRAALRCMTLARKGQSTSAAQRLQAAVQELVMHHSGTYKHIDSQRHIDSQKTQHIALLLLFSRIVPPHSTQYMLLPFLYVCVIPTHPPPSPLHRGPSP